ncbi:hypothetical protein LINGRAHAP2_LOCUS23847, partial [Linum grandiflorum]
MRFLPIPSALALRNSIMGAFLNLVVVLSSSYGLSVDGSCHQ